MPVHLDYYYGSEAEQYSFFRIPKALFTDSCYKAVSVEAKVLYGLLLDRMALSVKNGWLDKEGRVYIIFTVADMMETLGCAEQKANRLLCELDSVKGAGLIERKRRGLGKPNIIYVKNFIRKGDKGCQPLNCENHKSRNVKNANPEMRKSQTSNTDLKHTEPNETNPSICCGLSRQGHGMGGMDLMDACRETVKENIEYDILAQDAPFDRERLDGLVELMAEVCCYSGGTIRVNQGEVPAEVVKSRFLGLDSRHIRYVMDCMEKNTALIGNIRAYLLSALFNAPVTIRQYYDSLVSHDMAHGPGRGG